MTKVTEMTYADDPEKKFLRKATYNDVYTEIKRLEIVKEKSMYSLLNMIKYGNPVINLMCVDSILFPRHARWTLLFTNIILIWFFCAVIYNNTKDPLEIPDLNKDASKLAINDLWIAAYAPGGTIIIMYLFAALFKITDQRIKYAADL